MEINSLTVVNWKSIIHTKLLYKNLLIFIGDSNSGKSALMSAVACFFNPTHFSREHLRNPALPFKIMIEFYDKNNILTELAIETKPGMDVLLFKIYRLDEEEIITYDEFERILGKITILELSSYSKIPKESASFFIKKMITYLERNYPNLHVDHNFLEKKYIELSNLHINKSVSRNLIFEAIKYFSNFMQHNKIEKVENIFLFIENPELFLNPQEERELYDCIIKLSNLGVYIIIETHSSRFVGLKQYSSITIAKLKNGSSNFFQFRGRLFSGDEIKNFNMNYWINTDRGELFFAKKVILVEGQTDKMVLNYLGKILNVFKYNYTIVECGSKSLIPQFIKLCNSFRIPYIAVYDKDNHTWRSKEEIESSNFKNKGIQHSIDYSIGKFVEFYNDIEEEIYHEKREKKSYRNKPFNALKSVMSEEFILPHELELKVRKIWE